ncbi:MAG: hypothetical protein HYZ49_20130 [Chloroflexi bacterium]|nr:hypothetical protein [Chloroflexota bacterium]
MHTNRRNRVRLIATVSLMLLLIGATAGRAAAFDFRGGDTVTIGAGEVVDDDLFVGGNTVVVDGTVNGDLFASGSDVEVNGVVNGSLFVGGQTVKINGTVTGSVYGGAMSLTFGPQASVGRNALFGGFSLKAESGSVVNRDLLMGGYQALLDGEVGRDLKFGGSALELNGKVGGDVMAEVESPDASFQSRPFTFMSGMPKAVAPGLRVSEGAAIGGKLTYTSSVEQATAIQSAPEGGVAYQTPQPGQTPGPQPRAGFTFNIFGWIFDRLREFVTLMLLGALAVWKLPSLLTSATEQARAKLLPSAGWGLVVVIVGYVGAAIIGVMIFVAGILFGIITLGGLSQTIFGVGFSTLSLAFTVFTLLVSYGSKLVVAYLVGKVIVKAFAPQAPDNKWWPLVAGVTLYVLFRAIPLLGWLVGIAVTLVGVGAMWLLFRQWRAANAAPAIVPATPTS